MSITWEPLTHWDAVNRVRKSTSEENIVDRTIKSLLANDDLPDEMNCLVWFDRDQTRSISISVAIRTTTWSQLDDGRIEPYDSILERITAEYTKETLNTLHTIFAQFKTKKTLGIAYATGIECVIAYRTVSRRFDALAVEAREKACNHRQALWKKEAEALQQKGVGCVLPIVVGILASLLCFSVYS